MRGANQFDWNDENVALLEYLLRQGDSASKIAAQLGCVSRNAVIGKVHRTKHLNAIGLGGNGTKSDKISMASARQRRVERIAKLADKPSVVTKSKQKLHPGNIARKKAMRATEAPLALPTPTISSLEYEQDCLRLLIHELGPRQCKWEVNNAPLGEDHLFCAKGTEEGRPYCAHHRLKASGPGTRSEQTAIARAQNMHRRAA